LCGKLTNLGIQFLNQSGDILGMLFYGKIRAHPVLSRRIEEPQADRNHAIILTKGIELWVPNPVMGNRAVHEHDRSSVTGISVRHRITVHSLPFNI
jgi:hypothetical protein